MSDTVKVGDKIRFSTELLKQIDQMPDRQSETVEVIEIRDAEDGTKLITLQRQTHSISALK